MNNAQLSRKIDNLKRDFEYTIDELISEIENLENQLKEKDDEIQILNNQIEEIINN